MDPLLRRPTVAAAPKPAAAAATRYDNLDLDIAHYNSPRDLRRLFQLPADAGAAPLTEADMLHAKRIALMAHPDKSRLDSRYYLFFKEAYGKLRALYEEQTRTTRPVQAGPYRPDLGNLGLGQGQDAGLSEEDRKRALDRLMQSNPQFNPQSKAGGGGQGDNGRGFRAWFNEAFESHRVDDPVQQGYGDWLKSNDDFVDTRGVGAGKNVNDAIAAVKRQARQQQLVAYRGFEDLVSASSLGGAMLVDEECADFTSAHYTDLKQAYTQTLLAGSEDAVLDRPTTVQAVKQQRAAVAVADKQAQQHLLYLRQQQEKEEAERRAARLAEQEERAKAQQNKFWSSLLRIGN